MAEFKLNTAEQARIRLTQQQQRHIVQVYKNAAKSVATKARTLPDTPSSPLYKQQLNKLKDELNQELKIAEMALSGEIQSNMSSVSSSVVDAARGFNSGVGLNIEGAYSHVPKDVVAMVTTGQLYEGKWSLSRALWKEHMKTQHDINTVVATGIAANKSAYDIAKDLEKYLSPSAKKDWEWSKVYPGTRRKVDYAAQRLARTMVSHAYQQSFVQVTQKNPFVTEYRWLAAGTERTCELCEERNDKLFPKDDLPLDHPNGMCTFVAVIPDDMTAIADRLGDWASGASDPDIDAWIKSMGTDPDKLSAIQQQVSNPWGFSNITEPHTAQQDAEMSNPYYFKSSLYRSNCQRCVPTYELRRRGFDVISKPQEKNAKTDPVLKNWYKLFKADVSDWNYLKTNRKAKQAEEIRSMLTAWGAGSRAEIYVKWDGISSAHVFAAECMPDGSVVFIDPQNGLSGSSVESYFGQCMPSRTMVLRIDNRELSDWVENICESTPQVVNEARSKGAGSSAGWERFLKES